MSGKNSQLARFNNPLSSLHEAHAVRDLSLPPVESFPPDFNTETTTTFSFIGLGMGNHCYLDSVLKMRDLSSLDEVQLQKRESLLGYFDLYLQLNPQANSYYYFDATFIAFNKKEVNTQKFTLIEFLVERTTGNSLRKQIFNGTTNVLQNNKLLTWAHEYGLDLDELALLAKPNEQELTPSVSAPMSSHFHDLQVESNERQIILPIVAKTSSGNFEGTGDFWEHQAMLFNYPSVTPGRATT